MVFNTKRVFVAIICAVFILGFANMVTAGKIVIHIGVETDENGTVEVKAKVKSIIGAATVTEVEGEELTCAESIWFFKTFDEGVLKCCNVPFGTAGQYKKISFDPQTNGAKKIIIHVDSLTSEARIVQILHAQTIELNSDELICEEIDWKLKKHSELTCDCFSITILPGMNLVMCFGDTC